MSFVAVSVEIPAATFTGADIGDGAPGGTMTPRDAGIEIVAGGAGIGSRSDQFYFASQAPAGDFDVRVRVARLDNTDLWAKAGIMVRADTGAGAPFAGAFATPSGAGSVFQSRASAGAVSSLQGTFPVNIPFGWLRLQRLGTTITGFAGYDGRRWSPLGSVNLDVGAAAMLGLAVTSHASQPTTARFEEWGSAEGAVVGSVASGVEPLGPTTRRGAVVISEIMYHPQDRAGGPNLEFIEIHNTLPYFEDIGGWKLSGEVQFTFPVGTRIPGGGFIVVSASVESLRAEAGLDAVMGPFTGRLSNGGGRLELLADRGAVIQSVNYGTDSPWPVSADGGGHSLVLQRPSHGEGDPAAWGPSRVRGGSPGLHEAVELVGTRGIRINEIRPTDSSGAGFVELFNGSSEEASLEGMRLGLAASATLQSLPRGSKLAAGAFARYSLTELGIALGSYGGALWLESADRSRLVDAVRMPPLSSGWSYGRWPNGASRFVSFSKPTPEGANLRTTEGLVMTEVHFNPLGGDEAESFVELHNRGAEALDLAGWKFGDGIDFTFPPGTRLGGGGYLVVARNAERLRALHPSLEPQNVVGNFSGRLSGRGERLTIVRPMTAAHPDTGRSETVEVTMSEAVYRDKSRWSRWADGGGSTLELADPEADPTLGANWVDSDESSRSEWTTVEITGIVQGGAQAGGGGGGRGGGGGTPPTISGFQIQLMGEGECLVDRIEVIGPDGSNRLANANFDAGTVGWTFSGNHIRSEWWSAEGDGGTGALIIRASGNGDPGANKIYATFSPALRTGEQATLRARVKWLRGWPEILLRIRGNYLEAYGRLKVPSGAGSPGAKNTVTRIGRGPSVELVSHFPAVPAANEPVVVSARLDDPNGVASALVSYRLDPALDRTSLAMNDAGKDGDTAAGDGVWSGTLPGQSAGTLIAFRVEATSGQGDVGKAVFPPGGDARECLIRFGEGSVSGAFGTYRLWFTQASGSAWQNRPVLSNEPIDGTFVYGNTRVVYGTGARFAGSPYHQNFSGPTGDAHYVFEFLGGERVLGVGAFNKIHAPGNGPFDDPTIQREQLVYWMARRLGMPYFHRRFVQVYVNGAKRRTLMEDTQVGSDDFSSQFWPEDSEGDIFKMQPWFEFGDGTARSLSFANNGWCYVVPYTRADGSHDGRRYRWNWLVRGADVTSNSYSNVFDLVTAASDFSTPESMARLESLVDLDEWFRFFAINHSTGNWDSVGYRNCQNTYSYKPRGGKWELIIWDANIVYGNSGSDQAGNLPLFTTSDPTLTRWFAQSSPLRRRFLTAYRALANGPMQLPAYGPILDAKYAQFQEHGIAAVDPAPIKTYINTARNYILSQINRESAPFAITQTNGSGTIQLTGNGPLDMDALKVNDTLLRVTWSSPTVWSAVVPSNLAGNRFKVAAVNASGQELSGTAQEIILALAGRLSVALSGEGLEFDYPVSRGGRYKLQSTSNLLAPFWIPVTEIDAPVGPLKLKVPLPARPAGFYRMLEP